MSLFLYETSLARLYHHFTGDKPFAIISTYRPDKSEKQNKADLLELKRIAKKYGFNEFISRWVEDGEAFDERSLIIYGIPEKEAFDLAKKYRQSSFIYYDGKTCFERCVTPFESYKSGDIVRTYKTSDDVFNVKDAQDIFQKRKGGPASYPVKGNLPFTLKAVDEVIQARPSYFRKESYERLVEYSDEE